MLQSLSRRHVAVEKKNEARAAVVRVQAHARGALTRHSASSLLSIQRSERGYAPRRRLSAIGKLRYNLGARAALHPPSGSSRLGAAGVKQRWALRDSLARAEEQPGSALRIASSSDPADATTPRWDINRRGKAIKNQPRLGGSANGSGKRGGGIGSGPRNASRYGDTLGYSLGSAGRNGGAQGFYDVSTLAGGAGAFFAHDCGASCGASAQTIAAHQQWLQQQIDIAAAAAAAAGALLPGFPPSAVASNGSTARSPLDPPTLPSHVRASGRAAGERACGRDAQPDEAADVLPFELGMRGPGQAGERQRWAIRHPPQHYPEAFSKTSAKAKEAALSAAAKAAAARSAATALAGLTGEVISGEGGSGAVEHEESCACKPEGTRSSTSSPLTLPSSSRPRSASAAELPLSSPPPQSAQSYSQLPSWNPNGMTSVGGNGHGIGYGSGHAEGCDAAMAASRVALTGALTGPALTAPALTGSAPKSSASRNPYITFASDLRRSASSHACGFSPHVTLPTATLPQVTINIVPTDGASIAPSWSAVPTSSSPQLGAVNANPTPELDGHTYGEREVGLGRGWVGVG